MTATERLRELLDELGVEWQAPTGFDGTARHDTIAGGYWFHEFNGKISSCNCTNGERTNGTCHITDNGPWGYPYVCSACGASFDPDVNGGEFNYCPNCGRKVVP